MATVRWVADRRRGERRSDDHGILTSLGTVLIGLAILTFAWLLVRGAPSSTAPTLVALN